MLTNYFKIALRNLSKQKVLAFINIFGLSVGIACFSLFMLYALNEFNFDRFNTNAPNIYRVYLWFDEMNGSPAGASVYHPMPLGPAMKQDLSDVENYVRFHEGWGENFIKAGGTITREQVSFADPSFLNVFSFKLKYGNAEWSMVNGQWSMVNDQWSMVNGEWSMVNGEWSVVNGQWSVVSGQWSMVNGQWSMVNDQWSMVNGQ